MPEGINPILIQPKQPEGNSLKALEEKIIERESFIIKFCYKILKDAGKTDMAEELANQTLYKAVRAVAQYNDQEGSLDTWLATIAKNTIRDYLRKLKIYMKKTVSIEDLEYINFRDKNPNPEETVIEKERNQIRMNALKKHWKNYRTNFKKCCRWT